MQAPQSTGPSRQEYWSGGPFPSPGDLPDPGIEPTSLTPPVQVGRFFTRAARKVAFRTYFNTKSKAKKQNEHLKKTDRTLVNIQIGFKAVFVHGMMEKRRFHQEKKKKAALQSPQGHGRNRKAFRRVRLRGFKRLRCKFLQAPGKLAGSLRSHTCRVLPCL